LLDSELDLFNRLGLKGTPGTFIIDRHGYIGLSLSGAFS
jgi:hypothetical protein